MLENTLYKLKVDKALTVGYFGGSITEGAGASDGEKTSWRALHTKWMREHFPEAEITPIMAAIGGTGSDLGAYRIDNDLLPHRPDLVFVEFAVNDNGQSYRHVSEHYEVVLRKIYTANPTADVICLFTITEAIWKYMREGKEYISRAAQSAIAHAYGVSCILDVGMALADRILLDGGDWLRYTNDTVHPKDEGYKIYSALINGLMEKELLGKDAPAALTAKELPATICEKAPFAARLIPAQEVLPAEGWTLVDKTLCRRYPSYIESNGEEKPFLFRFTGSEIGLYMMFAHDTGYFYYRLDGGEWIKGIAYDKYCAKFDRACYHILFKHLPRREHTLEIYAAAESPENSKGNAIRIGAFMVG